VATSSRSEKKKAKDHQRDEKTEGLVVGGLPRFGSSEDWSGSGWGARGTLFEKVGEASGTKLYGLGMWQHSSNTKGKDWGSDSSRKGMIRSRFDHNEGLA